MDTASALMGLGLLFLFMAPIGYILTNQLIQEKKRKKALFDTAAKLQLKLLEQDFLSDLSLGLDSQAQKLLFVFAGKKKAPQVVDLKYITRCDLFQTNEENRNSSVIDDIREVYLELTEKGASRNLPFYSEEEHPVTEKEIRIQVAQKWQHLISENII
jgi:hypothetical protein